MQPRRNRLVARGAVAGGLATVFLVACLALFSPGTAVAANPVLSVEAETDVDTPVTISVLPADELAWRVVRVGAAASGTAELHAHGAVTYVPASGFSGVDTFEFAAANAAGEEVVGEVTVFVFAETVFAPEAPAGALATDSASATPAGDLATAFASEAPAPAPAPAAGVAAVGDSLADSQSGLRWVLRVVLLAGIATAAWLGRRRTRANDRSINNRSVN